MLQGMFGKRLAEHFSLLESSSLVLGPKGNSQVALTRMRMPNGFPGPTPHIPPEKAFSVSVHLRRPDSVKGWGTWLDGRFHRVTEWDAGGIQIFDMESEPVALRTSGFDSVHVYIPRFVLDRFSDENGQTRIRDLHCTAGTRDDVILHWARTMLPLSDRPLQLPRLVACPLPSTIYSALRTARSLSIGIRSKPFHLVINGKTATANSSSLRGRKYASRHVRAKIGAAFLSSGVFLNRAWFRGQDSGCVDAHAHAERLSRAHTAHSTRKSLLGIGAPTSSQQHQGMGNVD